MAVESFNVMREYAIFTRAGAAARFQMLLHIFSSGRI